ncbi:primosomal protein [Gulosibacter chungangensis]|uniref:Primosomal protein n=1 Tax=Gulosibacter chungangensis TaxID=979746 RepID=A0A7J5BCH3_9MICO|nr:primosomal protein [Gulosibacter chungangensis]KAB1643870.1 primosomal protein [Gulosibacter chungangensis]
MAEERGEGRGDRNRAGDGQPNHQNRGRSGSHDSRDGARGGSSPRDGGYRKRNDSYRSSDDRRTSSDRGGERKQYGRDGERKSYGRDNDRRSSYGRDGERKSYGRDNDRRSSYGRDGERKSSYGRDGERKSYGRDGERKSYGRDGERKSYGRDNDRRSSYGRDGERKSYGRDGERKSYGRDDDRRKSYGRDGERRPYAKGGDRKDFKRDGERRPYRSNDDRRGSYGRDDDRRRSYGRDDERRNSYGRDGGRREFRGGNDRRDSRGGREQREENSARLVPARPQELRAVRAEHEDPIIPEGITERDLDGKARMELKTLSKENAEFVAKHLAMASILIDNDPELAHQHALSASRRGGRIAMVREALAITAYSVGDFALALRELRTYRRISGNDDQVPLMVDCERGLGRPDRALELGRSIDKKTLPVEQQVQLAIAMSGARLDQGQPELALAELEIPQLDRTRAFDYSPGLFSAYATVLEDLDQGEEAKLWHKAAKRAVAALEAVSHNEFETIEIYSEDVELAEESGEEPQSELEDAVSTDADAEEAVAATLETESTEAFREEEAHRTDEAPLAESDESTEEAPSFELENSEIDLPAVTESIEKQIQTEYEEILAEVEAAADAAAADQSENVAQAEPEEPFELRVLAEDTLEPIDEVAPAGSSDDAASPAAEPGAPETAVSEAKGTVEDKSDSEDEKDSDSDSDEDSHPSLFEF